MKSPIPNLVMPAWERLANQLAPLLQQQIMIFWSQTGFLQVTQKAHGFLSANMLKMIFNGVQFHTDIVIMSGALLIYQINSHEAKDLMINARGE